MGAAPHTNWTTSDYLLANLIDSVNILAYITGAQYGDDNPLGQHPPEPTPRPLDITVREDDMPQATNAEDLSNFFSKMQGDIRNGRP
jgi:hypothetical protein